MKSRIHSNKASTTSAEEFESIVKPVSGPISITPRYSNTFNASISVSRLRRIGIALIDIDPMYTIIEPQHNFYCLSVPIVNPCYIRDGNSRREYSRNAAHLLHPDRLLDSHHKEKCKLLGVTYQIDNLEELAGKLLGSADALKPLNDCSIVLTTPAGINLVHQLSHLCGELNRGSTALHSDLSTVELEDDLITALLLAMDENQRTTSDPRSGRLSKCQIALAEDYLLDNLTRPVSRKRLADVAGVSIRSLSRAFVKRHGVGPMRFLRERRLEAVRMELINASPRNTKISDIALRYGFNELGKFSLLYRSVYNEKPSDTLKR